MPYRNGIIINHKNGKPVTGAYADIPACGDPTGIDAAAAVEHRWR